MSVFEVSIRNRGATVGPYQVRHTVRFTDGRLVEESWAVWHTDCSLVGVYKSRRAAKRAAVQCWKWDRNRPGKSHAA